MTPRILWTLASAFALAALLAPLAMSASAAEKAGSVLEFKVKDIDGKETELAKYKGEVLLIVNTASQCGYTPQYESLQAVFEKYKGKGFAVLGFPANEFGHQEPGTDSEIKQFCSSKYNVTFPMFSKIVVKGPGIHPLYQYLTAKDSNPKFAGDVRWNFAKFLVNRKGEVIARFEPGDKPDSPKVIQAIETALAEAK